MNGFLAVANVHEIAQPVDYSLVPPWVIYAGTAAGVALLILIAWWIRKGGRRAKPVRSPRDRALDALAQTEREMEPMTPYQFSIAVSDILRGYDTEQYALPVTRQTSVEFLGMLAKSSPFSADDPALL